MRHRSPISSPVLLALTVTASAAGQIVETRVLEETIETGDPDALIVEVDNVFGSIRVSGHDSATVEYTASETVRAETRADLERARAESSLRVERDGNRVTLRVGPSEASVARDCDCRWRRWDDYFVTYDFELRVPHDATLELATINGAIDLMLPSDASADVDLDSGYGEIWTDFDVEPLAVAPVRERRAADGLLVIRSAQTGRVRIGNGGPIHSLRTLTGDIHVRKASND